MKSLQQFLANYSPQVHAWAIAWATFSAAYIASPVLQAQVAAFQTAAHLPAQTMTALVFLVNLTNAYLTLRKTVIALPVSADTPEAKS